MNEPTALDARTGTQVMQQDSRSECDFLERLGAHDFTTEQEDQAEIEAADLKMFIDSLDCMPPRKHTVASREAKVRGAKY